jgi:hypothetical protein
MDLHHSVPVCGDGFEVLLGKVGAVPALGSCRVVLQGQTAKKLVAPRKLFAICTGTKKDSYWRAAVEEPFSVRLLLSGSH